MDPAECLKEVYSLMTDEPDDLHEALAKLDEYWTWRKSGGFEPMLFLGPGDDMARKMASAIKVGLEYCEITKTN